MPTPIARWNPARSVWETNETLICGHSDVWSETFPSSGMWAGGQVYELPTSAPPTDGSGSSSSPGLPTPTSRDWKGPNQRQDASCLHGALLPTPEAKLASSGPDYARMTREGSGGHDLITAVSLLPTPRATDGTKGGPNQRGSSGDLMLPSAVMLLPTPSVADSMGGHMSRSGSRSSELLLPGVARALGRGDLTKLPSADGSD